MNVNFKIKLTDGQQQALDLYNEPDTKELVLVWSRQSGKSVFAEIILIQNLFRKNSFNAYISPTYQLGRKVYKEIVKLLEPTNIIKTANSSTLTIETIYDSTLQFFSAESAQSIRGFTVTGVLIIDEAAYISDILPNGEDFWGNIVMPITKAKQPKRILISTPNGKSGFYYDHYLRALNNEDGIKCLKRTIYDDDLISEEEIEEIKRSISPKAFNQEFDCQFLDSSLTFFEGFEDCFNIKEYTGGKNWIGVDLSSTENGDNTILTTINENNEVKQHNITGTLDQKYKKIASLIDTYNPVATLIENNGIGLPMIGEIKKLVKHKNKVYEWATTNSSKEEIVSDLAVKIANKEIHFQKDDTELFAELANFIVTITKTKKLTFAARPGKHDDRVLSCSIALRCKQDFKYLNTNNNRFLQPNVRFIK